MIKFDHRVIRIFYKQGYKSPLDMPAHLETWDLMLMVLLCRGVRIRLILQNSWDCRKENGIPCECACSILYKSASEDSEVVKSFKYY